jgi:hypothetical protein
VTVVAPAPQRPKPDDPDLLFKEARRRRRTRWLISCIVVVFAAAVGIAVLTTGSARPGGTVRNPHPKSAPPQSVGLPTGAFQTLRTAGPLAVNATGSLFVVDEKSHEILVRLSSGKFGVVAGDGTSGFAGDGGPATKAELSDVTDLTFGPNGDLYLADSGRVRVVDPQGVIDTVVSPGTSNGLVTVGAAPDSASAFSQIASVAVSPTGVLYAATPDQIYRLTATNELQPVKAIGHAIDAAGTGQAPAVIRNLGQIAVDSRGNIYASSSFVGWSVYRITPKGVATNLGIARGSGGTTADVQLGPGDTGYAGYGDTVARATDSQLVPSHAFGHTGSQCCFYLQDFAYSSKGVLYADNLGESAFGRYQQIVSFYDGKSTVLWSRRLKE